MTTLRHVAVAVAVCLVVPRLVAAQDTGDYVSTASAVIGTYALQEADHSPEAMATAAQRLLDMLDDQQRDRITHALHSGERREWTNLPARSNAGGLRLGDCTEAQVKAACDLMATLFSHQGFVKMRDIMLADDQLLPGGRARAGFGTENFAIVIFGKPSPTEPWAFQIDGHHVGVNLAMHGPKMTMSPSFIGTQPHAFTIGEHRIRPLDGEIDTAYELVASLSDAQRSDAIISQRRGRIRTGPGRDDQVPASRGVACSSFTSRQRELLLTLIGHWVRDLPADRAEPRMQELAAEVDDMRFSWSGPTTPGSDISYVIQGPTVIIEYACQDLGGDPLDHLHTMYRNPTNEYGGQLAHDHDHDHHHH